MKNKLLIAIILLTGITFSLSAQENHKTPKFRINASGGLGYLTASGQQDIKGVMNKDVLDKANKNLRLAKNLNGEFHYLFSERWGLGVKYLFQQTSAEANDIILDISDGYHYMVMDVWEKDYVNFVGPSLFEYYYLGNNDNLIFTSSVSLGYAWLRSEGSLLNQNFLITSGNFAANAEVGLDYLFNKNLGIGFNLGYLVGIFNKIKINDGSYTKEQKLNKDSQYNASNIYLSVGLRYYLNK